jgi:hypothetical protein
LSLRAAFIASLAAALLGAFQARTARAEGEDRDPARNGQAYARWTRLIGARKQTDRGKKGLVLSCRYLGSSAQRDSAWEVQLKVIEREYDVSPEVARKLALSGETPELPEATAANFSSLCPVVVPPQSPGWNPEPGSADVARGLGLEERKGPGQFQLQLDLSTRTLSKAHNLCDDSKHRLEAFFLGHKDTRAKFCVALAEREFVRGMKRCLGAVNDALNRAYARRPGAPAGDGVSWDPAGPTQSYCGSLMMLAGPRFEDLLARTYDCSIPFATLATSDFTRDPPLLAAVQTVFAGTSVRVIPFLKKARDSCRKL